MNSYTYIYIHSQPNTANGEIFKKNENTTTYLSSTYKIPRESISSTFPSTLNLFFFLLSSPFHEQKTKPATNIFLARLMCAELPFEFQILFLIQNKYDRMNRSLLLLKGGRQRTEAGTDEIMNMKKIAKTFQKKKAHNCTQLQEVFKNI